MTSWRASDCTPRRSPREPTLKWSSLLREEYETEFSENENPWDEIEVVASSSRIGCGVTSMRGLSLSVPRMKREFLGLMQNSSTLSLLLVTMPWRAKK